MKNERQNVIAKLITENNIEKQEELIELLKKAGIDAAQATVSRDLRQMNVTKVSNGNGGMRYALPPVKSERNFAEYTSVFAASIISVHYAMNNVVIKTHTGMANAVAVGLDAAAIPEILGSVAGDDTIIVVTRSVEDSAFIADNILKMIEVATQKK